MVRYHVLAALALAACGGRASSSPPVAPIEIKPVQTKAAPKPACIVQPEEAAEIRLATGEGSRVQYCVGAAVDQCFELDLDSGKLRRLPEPPSAQDRSIDGSTRVETLDPKLEICSAGTCTSLAQQVWPGAAPMRAASNGRVAAVMLGDAPAGKGYIDVYDVARRKKLTSFKYARGEFRCGEVAMLGDTIYVGASTCTTPSARATLYTTKGKKIAPVGGKPEFGVFGHAFIQVAGTTWAFLGENGNKLAIQDVTKGKVAKTIDLGKLFAGSEAANMGNPGESAVVRLGNGKLAVIAGTPANGSVAVVDIASGAVTIVNAPLCG